MNVQRIRYFLRSVRTVSLGLLTLFGVTQQASADPFEFVFTGTWSVQTAGWEGGSDYTITVIADNGGATPVNQTYDHTDVLEVFIESGALVSGGAVVWSGEFHWGAPAMFTTDAAGEWVLSGASTSGWNLYTNTDSTGRQQERLRLGHSVIQWVRPSTPQYREPSAYEWIRSATTSTPGTPPGGGPVDSDGDGVPDDEDAFPDDPTEWADTDGDGVGDNADLNDNSDLRDTVVVGGCDTGVLNLVDEEGLCIQDYINEIEAAEYRNHGQYVSTVSHFAEDLLDYGAITEDEADTIVSCAARSDIGKKPKGKGKK